ncbi:uncharacterized protein (DUF58 family) [Inmirania thermothiophila]|uniref:Uncharacterized protein (DUF58 family) n=1 Tax=Inmirania thermothiophila TaxID=1750597 RepID=A0A3N1Y6H3_9GAMM|nr:uncharacterized protein (DUF58 family) [Inmirania thermothiophila]
MRWRSPRVGLAALARPARPRAGRARLGRRTVYILPTREGLLLAPALAALLLLGLHYNNNAALAFTFLLASVAVVAILHTYRELAGVGIAAEPAGEAFAGGRQRFRLRLDGGGRPRRVRVAAGGVAAEVAVPAEGEAAAVLAVPAPRRGMLALGRVRLETTRPLGLFRAWGYAETGAEAVVYPRPAPPAGLPPGGAGEAEGGADAEGGGGAFHDLGRWRDGESLRRVHWPLAARGRGLHLKRFAAPAGGTLWLTWEAASGDAEARLARLCRWVLDAEAAGLAYGLALPGARIPPGRGAVHRRRCLERLGRWPR